MALIGLHWDSTPFCYLRSRSHEPPAGCSKKALSSGSCLHPSGSPRGRGCESIILKPFPMVLRCQMHGRQKTRDGEGGWVVAQQVALSGTWVLQTQSEEKLLAQPTTCQNSRSKPIFFQEEPRTLVFHDTLHFQSFSNTFDNCLLIAYEAQGSVSSIVLVSAS